MPIIELIPPAPKSTFVFVREHVEHHRDVWVLEAFHEAVKAAQLNPQPFVLLERIASTEDGNLAERLVAAFARLDRVLRDGLRVELVEDRVRLSLSVGGTVASATEDETGWIITSHQTSWSDQVVH